MAEAGVYDIFDDLGLAKADNPDGGTKTLSENDKGSKATAKFLEVRFTKSSLLGEGDSTGGKIERISLPFHHDKAISDQVSAKIENQWTSASTVLASGVSHVVQNFMTSGGGEDQIGSFLKQASMFKYDAGNTQKTLQIPFIVPLALASKSALLNNAAKKMRDTFNMLEGILYPGFWGLLLPPLMELTIGGLYRRFYGFITGVNIAPTNNDMFQDPSSGEYFNMVYEGTITFSNLFLYYHDGGSGNDHFDIDLSNKAVLFGDEPLKENSFYSGYKLNGDVYYFSTDANSRANVSLLFQESSAVNITVPNSKSSCESATSATTIILPAEWLSDKNLSVSNAIVTLKNALHNSGNASLYNSQVSTLNNQLAELSRNMASSVGVGNLLDVNKLPADSLTSYRNQALQMIQNARNSMGI